MSSALLFLRDAVEVLARANKKLALAEWDRCPEHVLVVTHVGRVKKFELFADRLDHKHLARYSHHVNIAVRGRGRGVENAFAFN